MVKFTTSCCRPTVISFVMLYGFKIMEIYFQSKRFRKGGIEMRVILAVLVGIIGGFILGIALSSFIAVFGMILFDTPFGIKYLPYYISFLCAIAVPIIDQKSRRK